MQKNKNTIRLTEQEFNRLVEASVMQVLNEGKFGDFAMKVGKGIGKTALYGALGLGSLYAIDKGVENQEKYQQSLNRHASAMQGPTEDAITKWIQDNDMEDTPQNREIAWGHINNMLQNESKRNNRLSQIIREEISKVI